MLFRFRNYPRAAVLSALQAHELFISFGKGIDISKFQNIDKRILYHVIANHQWKSIINRREVETVSDTANIF